jgi:hypothetical protein
MKKIFTMMVIVSFFSLSLPQKSHAQYVDIPNALKEYGLDTVAVILAKTTLKKLTAKTVNWINSGFEGNPGYIQNPKQFFLDIGDETASQFLSQAGVNQLCSPFSAQVRLALVKNYINDDSNNFTCSLDILRNNYNAFTSDFTQGGWKGWFEITQNPQNNPYGAFLEARNSLSVQVNTQEDRTQKELDLSGGFLNLKRCPRGGSYTDTRGEVLCSVEEETVTPGVVINEQLTKALGSGWGKLEAADEINEVITALVTQLVDQVAGKASGLFGSSEPSTSGTGSNASLARQLFDELETPSVNPGPISASQPSLNCTASGGSSGNGVDTDGDGIIDSYTGGTGGGVTCQTTPGSISGVMPWPLGGGGGHSCPAYTPNPAHDCTRVDSGTVLGILEKYQPSNSGITAAEGEVRGLYSWASVIPHARLDKFDFGNGMVVDVIIGAVPAPGVGQGWTWNVECSCNRDPSGHVVAPTTPPIQLPTPTTYVVDFTVSGIGTISDGVDTYQSTSNASTTITKVYPRDSFQSIRAQASIGYTFVGWGGACAPFGNQPVCSGNVTGSGSVTATFR